MNLKQFDKIVTDQLSRSELVLMGKGTEYAEEATDETEVDRLAHFKKAAALQDMTTAQAAFGMLSKHLVSVADMVGSRQSYPLTQWNEKITDSIELCMALGGMAFKPYVSGGNVFIDSTSAASFIPLRFDDGDNCVSGVFKSQPVKVDKSYFVKLEYHDFANGVYTIRNKAFTSDENGITGSEVELGRVPEWAPFPKRFRSRM